MQYDLFVQVDVSRQHVRDLRYEMRRQHAQQHGGDHDMPEALRTEAVRRTRQTR